MERNSNSKVYINPNFKGNPLIQSLSTNSLNKTYINKYFTDSQNKDYMSHLIPGNRKIYVNPNFIQTSNNQECSTLTSIGRHQNQNNQYVTNKSKYSLIKNTSSNSIQNHSNQHIDSYRNSNTNTMNIQTPHINLNIAPLSKSRYCIIRKKHIDINKVEENIKSLSDIQNTMYTNALSCSNSNQTPNICKNNNNQPSESVVKIKISKYKTVPLTYLNKRNDNNRLREEQQNATKCEKFVKLAKANQYKYTKLNRVFSTNKLIVKPILKTNIKSNQRSWHNVSKTKVKPKFHINNIPCKLFTKYGKCLRQMYGNCQYLHDKKHISLCRKFLKGICHDSNCSLSHELTAKKMPTCYFYLKGMCTKDSCPYVHIKKSENIKICQDFLRGYCEKGESCLLKHNTSEKKVNNNSKRKMQQYKKVIKYIKISKQCKKKEASNDQEDILQGTATSDVDHRYYKELVTDDDICQIKPTRCKLGVLPSFIQL